MQFDQERNLLMCRMSSGIIYFVQLFKHPLESHAQILEMMQHYLPVKNEKQAEGVNKFCWVSRLNCYCEGTKLGYLRIRSAEDKGNCILQFPMTFTDKIRLLQHDKTKNLLFAASNDGYCVAWKLPPEWCPSWMEKKLRELRMEQGQKLFARI
jgi:hypothetical protein